MKSYISIILSLMCLVFIGAQEAKSVTIPISHDYTICDDVGGDYAVRVTAVQVVAQDYTLTASATPSPTEKDVSLNFVQQDLWLQDNRICLDSPLTYTYSKKRSAQSVRCCGVEDSPSYASSQMRPHNKV